jgi:hypothetical protein
MRAITSLMTLLLLGFACACGRTAPTDARGPGVAQLGDTVRGRYMDNAVWLTHNYVQYSSFTAKVPDLATELRGNYGIQTWFVNIGTVRADGHLLVVPAKAVEFLNALNLWEKSNRTLEVIAWVNGDTRLINIGDAQVRATVVEECEKLVSTTAAMSYVAGAARPFDGIVLDLEPSGQDMARFNALVQLTDSLHARFSGQRLVGHAAHQFGNGNAYQWSASLYQTMASHADFLVAMEYDSGIQSGPDYQAWMNAQVTSILAAVGAGAPAPDFRLFVGLAAYPGSPYHLPAVENIAFGAPGVDAAVTALLATGSSSAQWFNGVAAYLHTDGSGTDGYAGWSTDWAAFARSWLGR